MIQNKNKSVTTNIKRLYITNNYYQYVKQCHPYIFRESVNKYRLNLKHISNMCSGKTGATEGVPLNHKLGTVAEVVEDTIIDKDPLKLIMKWGLL